MSRGSFVRALLPSPEEYYGGQLLRFKNHSGTWRQALCVFHEEKNASLSVNLETGGYICHACGAKGGDVLDFHRQRYALRFTDAAQALGAWEGQRE